MDQRVRNEYKNDQSPGLGSFLYSHLISLFNLRHFRYELRFEIHTQDGSMHKQHVPEFNSIFAKKLHLGRFYIHIGLRICYFPIQLYTYINY